MPWWIVVSNSLIIHMNVRNTGNRRRSVGSMEAIPFQYALFFLGQHLIASVLHTVGPGILFQIFFTLKKKSSWCLFRIYIVEFQVAGRRGPGQGWAEKPHAASQEIPSVLEREKATLTPRFVHHFP